MLEKEIASKTTLLESHKHQISEVLRQRKAVTMDAERTMKEIQEVDCCLTNI
jgi:hypothetical protein